MNEYNIDYAGLKPGLYLQIGGNIKAIDVNKGGDDSILAAFGFDKHVQADKLANLESWTFTALSRRGEWIQSVPYSWMQGENELEEAPFGIQMRSLLAQLDKALQTKMYGAFLYKMRGMGDMMSLVWLDPDTVIPDLDTATHQDGITRFERKNDGGVREWIAAKDLIWFKRPGQRELQSDPAPLEASRKAAEVLYNMARLEDFFYEGAGLPIMMVMVPPSTSEHDKEELRGRFKRVVNALRNPNEIRTIAVREGVTVEKLSFSPSDLDLETSEERNRNKVLGVHQVPQSIAMSNAANYATAQSDQVQFANTVATRLEAIAEVFNNDADFKAAGYSLLVRRKDLPVLQTEETLRSQEVVNLRTAGESLQNAYALAGYEMPKDYVAPEEPEPQPEPESQVTDEFNRILEEEETKASVKAQFRRWYKNKGPAVDIDDFESDLTRADKAAIAYEVANGQDATFRGRDDSQENYP